MKKGFTLIEILLYLSLSAMLIVIISLFLSTILESRLKDITIAEVEQQGAQTMRIITQTVRNSAMIVSPATSTSASLLSLGTFAASTTPTFFDIASGTLRITEGASSPILLNNTRITVTDFTAQNLSTTSAPGTIRTSFTVTASSTSLRGEYYFSKTFTSSASLREH